MLFRSSTRNLIIFATNTNINKFRLFATLLFLGTAASLWAQTTTDPTDPDYIVMGGNGGSGSSNDGGDDDGSTGGGGTSGKTHWSETPAHTASVLLHERLVNRGINLTHTSSVVDSFLFGDDYVIQKVTELNDGFLVMGTFRHHLIVDSQALVSRGEEDIFLVYFDHNANLNWLHQIGGTGSDWGVDLIDSDHDGWTFGGQFSASVQVGAYALQSVGAADIMLVHIDRDGHVDWAQGVGGTGEDRLDRIQTNDNGMLLQGSFVQGIRFSGPMTLDNSQTQSFQVRYSHKGQLQWYALNER